MFEEVNTAIGEGLQNIDIIIQNHIQRQKGKSKATWGPNAEISTSVVALKEVAKLLSNTGVKLVLLLRAKPSDLALKSLLDELSSQVNIFLTQYL